jgi:dTDP-4-amino-4,6-dideoxygalactose transaminase
MGAVLEAMRSRILVGGGRVDGYRDALAEVTGADELILCPTGRFALFAALKAIPVEGRVEVIVQTYVCDAVTWAIEQANLDPVFCDIGPDWLPTPETVAARVTDRTAAIILAPPFGLFQPATPFRRFGLPIIHDLCQSNPLTVAGRWDEAGDICTFSFHPTKYLCAAGGGAAAVKNRCTSHPDLAKALVDFEARWREATPMNELQAAMGITQLERIDALRRRRGELAARYLAAISSRFSEALTRAADVTTADLFRFVVRSSDLDFPTLHDAFATAGIAVRRGVDQLAHRVAGQRDDDYPNATRAFAETMSLPFYPELTDVEHGLVLRKVAELLRD